MSPQRARLPWRWFGPGLLTALMIALAATFVSEHYGGPQFLYALFFGIAFNFLATDPKTRPGIEFAARTVLRFGVALLGVRITLDQIVSLGAAPVMTVVAAVMATIAVGAWLARVMKRPLAEGLLTGGAVAICGASAALAISSVLPPSERSGKFTLLTVVGVTLLSTVAMILYPLVVRLAHFDDAQAGIFLGGTIHDVAQVVGAGYIISPTAGDNATFVKLLRVAMLLPVVLVFSLIFRGRGVTADGTPLLPWFLIGFAALVAASSAGLFSAPVIAGLSEISRWCLVTAIAALGVKTSFQDFASLGWRPVVLMVGETAFLALLILGVLIVRGR
ncbi:MAG: YeiH family protein [Burkholderiales bacterium]